MLANLVSFFSNPRYFYAVDATVLLWLAILSFFLIRQLRHYQRLTKGVTSSDLRGVWLEHLARVDQAQKSVDQLSRLVDQMKKDDRLHLQKVSLVRFNPFGDMGGDQSFAIALLNGQGDGVTLSSLYGRGGTRIYGKTVKAFKGFDHELSEEEEKVINYAAQSKS